MKQRIFIILFSSLLFLSMTTTYTFGIMIINKGGNWPANWPEVLEPFRPIATTGNFMGGSQATYYYIEFETRDEFESVWPSILKLKSKGAPLTLHNIDKPSTDPNDTRVLYTKPQVLIICPIAGVYQAMPDGRYIHKADWTEDIENQLIDDVLPQFVGKDSNGKWSIDPNIVGLRSLQQARIELSLYIDGKVIDLNRIHLPENTPIKDYRKFEQ